MRDPYEVLGVQRNASAAAIKPAVGARDPIRAGDRAMNYWFTRADAPIVRTHVKRFDPLHWTVDFPRGAIASLVTSEEGHGLTVTAEFLREGDLVGLIWDSEDRHAHPAHARETSRDYSNCVLHFHWESSGLIGLDAPNGPTLTIEGNSEAGDARVWLVRLWNYAEGTPTSADVTLDFDSLDGGFSLPNDAVRVDPRAIDRMFISLAPPGYVEGSSTPAPAAGSGEGSKPTTDTFAGMAAPLPSTTVTRRRALSGSAMSCTVGAPALTVIGCSVGVLVPESYGKPSTFAITM